MPYKPTRAMIEQECAGMLQMQLFVVLTTPVPGQEHLLDAVTPDHLAHQVRLERAGALLAAGPFWTEDGLHHTGEGMFILRADGAEQARALCDADPMHARGVRRYTLRPWMMNEGGLTVTLRFSDQTAQIR